MQTREDCSILSKDLAKFGVQNITRFLVYGAVATNYYIMLAPDSVQKNYTCEKAWKQFHDQTFANALAATFIYDTGLYVFNTAGSFSGMVIPTVSWAADKISEVLRGKPLLEEDTAKWIAFSEQMFIKLISSPVFIKGAIDKIAELNEVSDTARYAAYTAALLPLTVEALHLGMRKYFPDYPSTPSWPALRNKFPDRNRLANGIALLESAKSALKSASAAGSVSWLAIDLYVDAPSPTDFQYTNQVILACAGAGLLLGMLSVLNDTTYKMANHGSTIGNMFYIIAMTLVSEMMCLNPSEEEPEKYKKNGIYFSMLACVVALGAAIAHEKASVDIEYAEKLSSTSVLDPENPGVQSIKDMVRDVEIVQDDLSQDTIDEQTRISPISMFAANRGEQVNQEPQHSPRMKLKVSSDED